MFNPFREHFWRHVWGRWSEPIPGYIVGTNEPCMAQRRVCRVCGKVENRVI